MKIGYDISGCFTGPLEPGWYVCEIVKSEVRQYKENNLHYIVLTLNVLEEGPYKGRRLKETLHIGHPNSEKARQMAVDKLRALFRALKIKEITETEMLHGHPISVYVEKNKHPRYKNQNVILRYHNIQMKSKREEYEMKIKMGAENV